MDSYLLVDIKTLQQQKVNKNIHYNQSECKKKEIFLQFLLNKEAFRYVKL